MLRISADLALETAMQHRLSVTHVLKGVVGFSFLAAVGSGALAPLAGIEVGVAMRSAITVAGAVIGGILGARS